MEFTIYFIHKTIIKPISIVIFVILESNEVKKEKKKKKKKETSDKIMLQISN